MPTPHSVVPWRTPEDRVPEEVLDLAADEAVSDAISLLREALEEAGISQAMLAERLGQTRSNVAQILSPESRNPLVRTAAKWLYALGYRLVLDIEPLTDDAEVTEP